MHALCHYNIHYVLYFITWHISGSPFVNQAPGNFYLVTLRLQLWCFILSTKTLNTSKLWNLYFQVPNISPSEAEFKPCVDNHVMLDIPRILLHDGRINPVSFMTGTVKDEWTKNIGWFIQELYSDIPHLGAVSFFFKLQSRHSNMRCWGVISLQKLNYFHDVDFITSTNKIGCHWFMVLEFIQFPMTRKLLNFMLALTFRHTPSKIFTTE